MKKYKIRFALIGVVILMSGCTSKDKVFPDPDADIKHEIESNKFDQSYRGDVKVRKMMPYQIKTSLIVESRSNDEKVIVNAGKVLKILVTPYKRGSTLIAGHDIYTYVKKPGFIVGQSVPARATDSITTPSRNLPFDISKNEFNIDTDIDEISNNQVKKFNNDEYKKNYGYLPKNIKRIKKYESLRDNALREYIKLKEKGKK